MSLKLFNRQNIIIACHIYYWCSMVMMAIWMLGGIAIPYWLAYCLTILIFPAAWVVFTHMRNWAKLQELVYKTAIAKREAKKCSERKKIL